MALAAGDRVGPYEIISALGAGGMGEVYRARDRKLNRDVAIKVLPDGVAADPDRVARFEREAQVLASLNHSNIAHLYGVEQAGSVSALVLELVEGVTLAEKIEGGALNADEALSIARQIAEALEAAHERGVVHRDLKPANVKLTPSGVVKVLDFGLAKAMVGEAPPSELANSPTLTGRATRQGIILGTAAYMSPEQARGEPVDRRADVWAFGVVFFEMLTGSPLFERQTAAETIAAVLQVDPDWNLVPYRFRRLLRVCLTRDPRRRLHDIADVWLLLDDDGPTVAPAPARGALKWLPWTVAVASVAVAAWAWMAGRTAPSPARPVRFQIALQGDMPESGASAISPDGRYLAFLSRGSDQVLRVWVRDLQSQEDRQLVGTEIGQAAPPPFWSPDSRFIAYDAGGSLKKIDISGGLPQTICEIHQPAIGGTWNRDGVILFGNITGGVMRVSDGGGAPSPVTMLDTARQETAHVTPVFLPDGRHFLYLRSSRNNLEQMGVFVGSLDREPKDQDARRLVATTTSPVLAREGNGGPAQILFLRDGNLMAQRFDERALAMIGDPALVSEGVHSFLDTATVSSSENGTLVYKRSARNTQLTWFDRQGRIVSRLAEPAMYGGLSLSPDATRVVVVRTNAQVSSNVGLWMIDLASGGNTRFASPVGGQAAVWSPDSRRIAYVSSNSGFETELMQKPAAGGGPEASLVALRDRASPSSWSPDGLFLLYVVVDPKTNSDLWAFPLDGVSKPFPFLQTAAIESQAQFSPDGKQNPPLVALTSNESGRDEIELRTFPDGKSPMTVSNGGGHSPRWRADGKELFYLAADGTVMSVAVSGNPLRVQPAVPLFRAPRGLVTPDATGRRGPAPWDVTADGQRFLIAAPLEGDVGSQFTVVLNWQQGLAAK
jgi:eukaryotic-like serine/threonine-protein kinase